MAPARGGTAGSGATAGTSAHSGPFRWCARGLPSTFMGREARGQWDRRRREQMRTNGPRESFTIKEIGERDFWRCGICLDPVDPKIRRPDPRAPSVDHIKALWAGGTHTRDNVRITHLFCNMDRNYVDAPTLSPVRVVRNQAGELIVVVGDSSSDEPSGEVVLDRKTRYPRTPEEARKRLARRVARYEAGQAMS